MYWRPSKSILKHFVILFIAIISSSCRREIITIFKWFLFLELTARFAFLFWMFSTWIDICCFDSILHRRHSDSEHYCKLVWWICLSCVRDKTRMRKMKFALSVERTALQTKQKWFFFFLFLLVGRSENSHSPYLASANG